MWERRSRSIFWSSVILSSFILIQMSLYTANMMFDWASGFNILEICQIWLEASGLYILGYVLNVLVLLTLGHSIWLLGRQLYWSKLTCTKLRAAQDQQRTRELSERLGLDSSRLLVTSHTGLIAVTMGFFRPKIVISAGLLQLLDEDEMEAVLLHEQFHQLEQHPMKSFLTLWLSSVLWYIPILSYWHRYYKITQEVLADKHAIEVKGEETSLGSALVKLMKKSIAPMPFAYSAFADTSVNYRIKHMIDPQAEVALPLPWSLKLISAAVIMGLTSLFVMLGS
jgi:Zn-dependent protease with chaperone function